MSPVCVAASCLISHGSCGMCFKQRESCGVRRGDHYKMLWRMMLGGPVKVSIRLKAFFFAHPRVKRINGEPPPLCPEATSTAEGERGQNPHVGGRWQLLSLEDVTQLRTLEVGRQLATLLWVTVDSGGGGGGGSFTLRKVGVK
jgi:hypothetical protein